MPCCRCHLGPKTCLKQSDTTDRVLDFHSVWFMVKPYKTNGERPRKCFERFSSEIQHHFGVTETNARVLFQMRNVKTDHVLGNLDFVASEQRHRPSEQPNVVRSLESVSHTKFLPIQAEWNVSVLLIGPALYFRFGLNIFIYQVDTYIYLLQTV